MAEFEAGNLYEMNKKLVTKHEKQLRGKALYNQIEKELRPYLMDTVFKHKYFMLLCHEKRDYTVFNLSSDRSSQEFSDIIIEKLKLCLHNRGAIYGIDRTEDGVGVEIWLKYDSDGDMVCYYFFPYTEAVIEI